MFFSPYSTRIYLCKWWFFWHGYWLTTFDGVFFRKYLSLSLSLLHYIYSKTDLGSLLWFLKTEREWVRCMFWSVCTRPNGWKVRVFGTCFLSVFLDMGVFSAFMPLSTFPQSPPPLPYSVISYFGRSRFSPLPPLPPYLFEFQCSFLWLIQNFSIMCV